MSENPGSWNQDVIQRITPFGCKLSLRKKFLPLHLKYREKLETNHPAPKIKDKVLPM